jgi:quercetin dioxygenase-like cupin family protein
MYKTMVFAAILIAASALSIVAFAEDAVIADPVHYAVEFENDKVRIIRIKYGPGEKSVMHTHGPNASIIITSATMRMTTPDGKSEVVTMQAGDVAWADAEEHLPENLSDGLVEVVLVELKH